MTAIESPRSARNEIVASGRLGGHRPEELADRFGTPFFVYDLDVVTRQVEALRAAVPEGFRVAFALKANPSLGVVAHLARLGLGGDVASAGELATALRAGMDPGRIVFTGPGKTDAELRGAVQANVGLVTVESPGEARRLAAVAAEVAARPVRILLRAAATSGARHERLRVIGDAGVGKFGMDSDALGEAADFAVRSAHLDPIGVHAFGASNVLDPDALAEHLEATMAIGRRLARASGFPLRSIDVGGGLGIPYAPDEEPLDLARLAVRLGGLARAWKRDPITAGTEVILEPGRFLVGPAGAYVSRVVDRKTFEGRAVAILDGGIHHLLRPALVGQEHRVQRLTGGVDRAAQEAPLALAGPLCTGNDVLATGAALPALEPGDLVAFLDAGAYGFTESMPFFLSHPIPAELAIRGSEVAVLRPRLEPSTWLDWQVDPAL